MQGKAFLAVARELAEEAQRAIDLLDQIDADPERRNSAIASIPSTP